MAAYGRNGLIDGVFKVTLLDFRWLQHLCLNRLIMHEFCELSGYLYGLIYVFLTIHYT